MMKYLSAFWIISSCALIHYASAIYETQQQTHFYQKKKFTVLSKRMLNLDSEPPTKQLEENFLYQLLSAEVKLLPDQVESLDEKKRLALSRKSKSHIIEISNEQEEGSFCHRSFDGRSGYCIPAFQCLHVIREYRAHGTKIDICTYRNNIPVICCTLSDKDSYSPRISEKKCHKYYESLKGVKIGLKRQFSGKTCVTSVPLIIGGNMTQTGEYPHMAAVGWSQIDDILWGCGGSLISENFVLTAAHCTSLQRTPPDIVRLGITSLNAANPEDVPIQIIILHPKYNSTTFYYDIALFKLKRFVKFTNFIQPACLWQVMDIGVSSAIATGWGRTQYNGPSSENLQKVKLNTIDPKICKQIYRNERRFPNGIADNQLCAGQLEGEKDTCQGDSGGPLHVEVPELKCIKFIIGITSFGKYCAAPNAPGVYTKISAHLDWIEKVAFVD